MIQAQIGDVVQILVCGKYLLGEVVAISNQFISLKNAVSVSCYANEASENQLFDCYDKDEFKSPIRHFRREKVKDSDEYTLTPFVSGYRDLEIQRFARIDQTLSDIGQILYHPTRCKPFDCEEVVQEEATQQYDFDGIIDALFHATQTLSNALSQSIPSSVGSRIRVNIAGEVYEGLVGSIRGSMFLLSAATKVYTPHHGEISAKVNDFWTHTCNVRTLRHLAKNEG